MKTTTKRRTPATPGPIARAILRQLEAEGAIVVKDRRRALAWLATAIEVDRLRNWPLLGRAKER